MKRLYMPKSKHLKILFLSVIFATIFFNLTGCLRKGDAPAGDAKWVLKETKERPDCVKETVDVLFHHTAAGIKYVRTPDDRFKNLPDYPFTPHYIDIDGLRMHYVDEGPRNGEIVLLLHGQPSWSYLYRKMIPLLSAAGYRSVAVDLIGMGRSDKPVELGIHTYLQHTEWIRKFIGRLNLKNITLFCQDWGGLMGLHISGEEPQLFSRIVAANTTLPIIEKGKNPFRVPNPVAIDCDKKNFQLGKNALSKILMSDYREKLPNVIQQILRVVSFQGWINYALTAPDFTPSRIVEYATVNRLSEGEAAAYDAPYPSLVYKAAVRTLPSMIAAVEDQNTKAWDNLGKFNKPFLFLAGERDKNFGSKKNQNLFINHIPGANGQPHDRFNAHHFIQEDIGEILADRVIAFIKNNPIQ